MALDSSGQTGLVGANQISGGGPGAAYVFSILAPTSNVTPSARPAGLPKAGAGEGPAPSLSLELALVAVVLAGGLFAAIRLGGRRGSRCN